MAHTFEQRPVTATYASAYLYIQVYLPILIAILGDLGILMICYICSFNMLLRNMYTIDKYGGVTALNASERVGYGSLTVAFLTSRLVTNLFGPPLEPQTAIHVLVVVLLVASSWALLLDVDEAYQWHVKGNQSIY